MIQLAYYAKGVNKTDRKIKFGQLIDKSIDTAKLKKKDIAREAGIHPTSLSRIISAEMGATRETVVSIVKAINKIANREIVSETEALGLLGLLSEDGSKVPEPVLEAYAKSGYLQPADNETIAMFIRGLNAQREREAKEKE